MTNRAVGSESTGVAKTRKPFYLKLTFQLIAGMMLGVIVGVLAPNIGRHLKPLGTIFIHLIQMVVGLIIFCVLTRGIAGERDMGSVGRVAIKALIYFEVVTLLALVIGLVTINILKPGVGMNVDPTMLAEHTATAKALAAPPAMDLGQFFLNMVPKSAVQAFAQGAVLQILVFTVLFAGGLASLGAKAKPVLDLLDTIAHALFWIIGSVMKIAPIAAFGAIAFTVSRFGLHSMVPLITLIGEFYLTVALFFVLILTPISLYAGFNLLKLMRYIREELVLVLGTSSSESVFPQLLHKLEKLGVDGGTVGLVLPLSYSFNHDGTCLYWAAVCVFLAQATNTPLGWEQQLGLLMILLLTSKGGANVAGSAIAILTMTLAATNTIPVESIALVLGIHTVLSAAFVFTNIAGDCVATIVVAHWEKTLDRKRFAEQLELGYDKGNKLIYDGA